MPYRSKALCTAVISIDAVPERPNGRLQWIVWRSIHIEGKAKA
ncbi:MAG TPA: hypothetical protein VF534_12605 [Paraburkholderia sp.]